MRLRDNVIAGIWPFGVLQWLVNQRDLAMRAFEIESRAVLLAEKNKTRELRWTLQEYSRFKQTVIQKFKNDQNTEHQVSLC